jgi:hypothetical protein
MKTHRLQIVSDMWSALLANHTTKTFALINAMALVLGLLDLHRHQQLWMLMARR